MTEFFQQLIAVDWGGLIGAAVASGVGLSFITQLLKAKWIAVPASKYPRAVSAVLAVLVGIISTISVGLELSSLASFVVFAVVAFVTSGVAYDVVKRLVLEIKQEQPVTELGDVKAQTLEIDHLKPNIQVIAAKVNPGPEATQSAPDAGQIEQVARDVMAGKYGRGSARRMSLEKAGFNFEEVQAKVKELVAQNR